MLRDRMRQQMEGAGILPEEGGENLDPENRGRNRDRNRDQGRDGDQGRDRSQGRDRNRGDEWWDHDDERDVVERRGGRIILDLGNGNLWVEPIAPDEGGRLLYGADDVEVQNLRYGRTRTIVYRRNGVAIVTVRDRYGDIIRRSKILPDGTEIVLIDNRYPDDYEVYAPLPPPILYDVPPLVIGIPQDQYIVDYGNASEDDIRTALLAPPVQPIERPYTLDEVLNNQEVRAYSPRIDLDTITFDTGSATISVDQMNSLYGLGEAMEQVITDNPDEVYLIEGHTDAVGSTGGQPDPFRSSAPRRSRRRCRRTSTSRRRTS